MRQKKKSKVEVLEKKLAEIKSGKWNETDENIAKLKESLRVAKMQEGNN